MKKYTVTFNVTTVVSVEVEAEDEDEACATADILMTRGQVELEEGSSYYEIDSVDEC